MSTPILECCQLSKAYTKGRYALDDVTIQLKPGRIVGLLGPNGSGKSTFIKLAAGLLTPTEGEIFIEGTAPGPETKALVSYLPDRTYLNKWMKVRDLISFFCDFYEDFCPDTAYKMLEPCRSIRKTG
jgi:ABC-2 type transport system ATP-binding protein